MRCPVVARKLPESSTVEVRLDGPYDDIQVDGHDDSETNIRSFSYLLYHRRGAPETEGRGGSCIGLPGIERWRSAATSLLSKPTPTVSV